MKKSLLLLSISLLVTIGVNYGQEYAVEFDSAGTGTCVKIPAIAAIQGDAARTVECWVKAKSGQESEASIIQWGVDASGEKFAIRLNNNDKELRVEHGGGYKAAITPLNDDSWHHVAVVIEESSGIHDSKLYVDGVEEAGSQSGGDNVAYNTGDSEILLSRAYNNETLIPTRHFNGAIDELRLWNKALTEEEINTIMDSVICPDDNPDLVAYFRFNENTGSTVADETGSFDGVLGETGSDTENFPEWVEGYDVEDTDCNPGTGIHNKNINSVLAFPNPAYDYVQFPDDLQINQVSFYNILGKKYGPIKGEYLNRIDISFLESGMYIVELNTDNNKQNYFFKLLKK